MENPVEDVPSLIKSLCQGSAQQQKDALETYFLPNAAFQHPLCRVPSLSWKLGALPLVGEVNSRLIIMSIYRWYRLLSPKIELKIHSTMFNEDVGRVYVDMSQIFAIWFIPFYKARAHLVVVLDLVPERPDTSYRREGLQYSDVTAERKPRYFVAKQEDRYQLNDAVNFLLPGLGPLICRVGQDLATLACVLGVLVSEALLRVFFGANRAERTPLAYKPMSRVE